MYRGKQTTALTGRLAFPCRRRSTTNPAANRPRLPHQLDETYFQVGNQNAANEEEGNQPPSKVEVFGTESCMGCHSSAGIATSKSGNPPQVNYSGQLTADLSWLMEQKAQ